MATITEDYVSFKTAKLLKEKGFPQEYDDYHALVYNEEDYEDEYEVQRMVLQTRLIKAGTLSSYPVEVPEPKCYCPTLQMAIKWLMENHNICIVSLPVVTDDEGEAGCLWNYIISKKLKTLHNSEGLYEASEFALSNGLKYALKNLI